MRRLLLLASAGLALLAGCGLLPEEEDLVVPELPEPPRVTAVVTYAVERGDLSDQFEGYARVSPVRETALYFQQSGRLQSLAVQPNDSVREGDVLARLDIDAIIHELRLSEIDLQIAEAHLEKLSTANAAPVDRRIQELVVERHRTVVERARRRVETATIRAPHDGVVRRVLISVSDMVREFEPVIEIADPALLELQMSVSMEVFRAIEPAMEAEVQVQPQQWVPVRILRTAHHNPRFDASVRREEFTVHLSMPDGDHGLRSFSQYPVRIIRARRENTLVIPTAALREARGREYVRVMEDEIRREVDVLVGVRGPTRVEILEGLSEGELVIGR